MNALVPSDPRIEHIGPYRVLHRLSSERSGEIVLAADDTGTRVVLKGLGAADPRQALLDPKIADDARSYARLSHPNLVKMVDLFSADGQFFVALEYVDGRALDAVHAALLDDSEVDATCWIYVASSIIAALAAAHEAVDADGKPAPIVHQRVSPSHVQIAWDGTVKLGAFSMLDVVKVTRASGDDPSSTSCWRYRAPEQDAQTSVGPYTDVYSAMLVVRELLAEAGNDLAGATARVSEVIAVGLEPDPTRRLGSAARARDVFRASIDMAGARKRFAAALARMRLFEEAPVSRDLAPTKPYAQEAVAIGAPGVAIHPMPESSHLTDDSPTVVRPPTDEELQALSAVRPKPADPAASSPPAAIPRRPPPLPPRAKRPAVPVALPPVVELDIAPEPEPEVPVHRAPRALRAAFRVIRGALGRK
jgi:serine/threonine-protein kinase